MSGTAPAMAVDGTEIDAADYPGMLTFHGGSFTVTLTRGMLRRMFGSWHPTRPDKRSLRHRRLTRAAERRARTKARQQRHRIEITTPWLGPMWTDRRGWIGFDCFGPWRAR